jgi:predicted HTH transcriptional regulator
MAGNEPLGSWAEATPPPSMSLPEKIIPVAVVVSNKNKIVELLTKAKNTIQFKKRKKLEKIMAMFLKKSKITNDEVEKLLHVSDATATRYLSQLEKEGKIKQTGKTGHAVFYVKI